MNFNEYSIKVEWEKRFYSDNCDDLFVPCLPEEKSYGLRTQSAAFIIFKYIFLLIPAMAPLTWIANGKYIGDLYLLFAYSM